MFLLFRKKIIGVPIIPGVSSSPTTAQSVTVTYDGSEAPPSKPQLPSPGLPRVRLPDQSRDRKDRNSSNENGVEKRRSAAREAVRASLEEQQVFEAARRSAPKLKFEHVDFLPKQLKENEFEKFS